MEREHSIYAARGARFHSDSIERASRPLTVVEGPPGM